MVTDPADIGVREILFTEALTARLIEGKLPEMRPGEVLVRTLVSLVSSGTETTAFRQAFAPDTHWASYAKLPFRPGYASVCEVIGVGSSVDQIGVGTRVLLERPHASHHILDAGDCQVIPDAVASEDAVWFTLAQIAFRGYWASGLRLGDSVVVVGAGPIGQMVTRWASAAGLSRIAVVDPIPGRLKHATAGGSHFTFETSLRDFSSPPEHGGGGSPSTYVDTTGNPSVFADILRAAPPFGRVVLLGDAGRPDDQHLTGDLLLKGLTIVGAFGSHERDGWTDWRVRQLFLDLLSERRMSVDGLITHRFEPTECQTAYELLESARGEAMGVAFIWT